MTPPPLPRVPTALLALLAAAPLPAQPTNNPVLDFFGREELASPIHANLNWTDGLPWGRALVITDFPGATDAERLAAAQDAAVAAGGGVVYFPAGTYTFAEDVYLRDGVILRGAEPTPASALDDAFRPPTRFEFPRYIPSLEGTGTPNSTAFKGIYRDPAAVGARQGLVHLDLNRAKVSLGGSGEGAREVVVFGVRSNNVATPSPGIPTASQHAWQRQSYRFARNLLAFARRDVTVSNCRVNDLHRAVHLRLPGWETAEVDDYEQPGYLVQDGSNTVALTGPQAVFSYTDHYGIGVRGSSGDYSEPPWKRPDRYYPGAVIRGNWVYATMRVKIMASGDGLVIRDNVLLDRPGKTHWMHSDGTRLVGNSNTLENRGIDWIGTNVLIENNDVEVYRHLLRTGPYLSVDGEGILVQEVHSTILDGAIIRNNRTNAYIGIYKMPYTRNLLIAGNTVTNDGGPSLWIDADTNNDPRPMANVVVEDNVCAGSVILTASLHTPGATAGVLRRNRFTTATVGSQMELADNLRPDGTAHAPADITVRAATTAIPAAPELRLDVGGAVTPGQVALLRADVLNDTPVAAVRFYAGTTLLGEVAAPPYRWAAILPGDPPRFSAEAVQAPLAVVRSDGVERNFTQYSAALPRGWTRWLREGWTAWAEAAYSAAERSAPDWFAQLDPQLGLPPMVAFALGRSRAAPDRSQLLRVTRVPGPLPAFPGAVEALEVAFTANFFPGFEVVLEESADLSAWAPATALWSGPAEDLGGGLHRVRLRRALEGETPAAVRLRVRQTLDRTVESPGLVPFGP